MTVDFHQSDQLAEGYVEFRFRRRNTRLAHLGAIVAPIVTGAMLGGLLSYAIASDWLSYWPFILGGGLWLIVTVNKPHVGLTTMLVITSSVVFEESLPVVEAGGRLHIFDLMFGFMLLLVLLKRTVNRKFAFVRTPLDLPLVLFAASSIVAIVTSARYGIDYLSAAPEARIVLLYLTFFIVTNLVRDERALRWLVKALFITASLTAAVTIAQAVVGSSIRLLPGLMKAVNVATQEFSGISRLEPPGIVLMLFMLIVGVAFLFLGDTEVPFLPLLAIVVLLLVAVILSFYRSTWVAVIMSIGLVFLVLSPARKGRLIAVIPIVIPILGIVVIGLRVTGGKVETYTEAIVARGVSMITGEAVISVEETWNDRVQEVEDALKSITAYPLVGIGYGNPYRTGGRFRDDRGVYVHNGYVSILLKMGLIGFIPFILLVTVFLGRGYRLWKRVENSFFRSVSLGVTAGFAGLLIANISDPRFIGNMYWTPVLGVVMGINEVIFRLYVGEGGQKRGRGGKLAT